MHGYTIGVMDQVIDTHVIVDAKHKHLANLPSPEFVGRLFKPIIVKLHYFNLIRYAIIMDIGLIYQAFIS